MPTITALTLYPIKSCAGISLQVAMVTRTGLSYASIHDREWMVVDQHGQFLTQREHPRMALIRPSLGDGHLVLHAEDVAPLTIPLLPPDALRGSVQVQVWDDVLQACDEGEASAAWLSDVIGMTCRLVRFAPTASRVANNKWTAGKDVPTRFSDGYPLLLISEASLADLNLKLLARDQRAVPMNRFRPNIVIDGVEAFEEDYAESLTSLHEENEGNDNQVIRLTPLKPCPRCPMPAVDQMTGEVGPNPVDTLQSYRSNALMEGAVTFGMNVMLSQGEGQLLHVGDMLELHLAF
jgi:uncharacterized protein